MNIHILGICGTFMGGIAALARADGHSVSGQDQNVYPPMSTQLEELGIDLAEGYSAEAVPKQTDLVIIGNALSRGNPAVEYVLDAGISYVSGPRWLGENYLTGKQVLAVAGTHGKTTTASMLACILEHHGMKPGFLIGGIPANFGISARAGKKVFIVEADEYDTAFFDKRAKFVHYRPSIAILNNLEFDHADIYPDLAAIETQFHHLMRTIPGNGSVVVNQHDTNLRRVLERGCWSHRSMFGIDGESDAEWRVRLLEPAGRRLEIFASRYVGRHAGVATDGPAQRVERNRCGCRRRTGRRRTGRCRYRAERIQGRQASHGVSWPNRRRSRLRRLRPSPDRHPRDT